jgi:hypothetical protein
VTARVDQLGFGGAGEGPWLGRSRTRRHRPTATSPFQLTPPCLLIRHTCITRRPACNGATASPHPPRAAPFPTHGRLPSRLSAESAPKQCHRQWPECTCPAAPKRRRRPDGGRRQRQRGRRHRLRPGGTAAAHASHGLAGLVYGIRGAGWCSCLEDSATALRGRPSQHRLDHCTSPSPRPTLPIAPRSTLPYLAEPTLLRPRPLRPCRLPGPSQRGGPQGQRCDECPSQLRRRDWVFRSARREWWLSVSAPAGSQPGAVTSVRCLAGQIWAAYSATGDFGGVDGSAGRGDVGDASGDIRVSSDTLMGRVTHLSPRRPVVNGLGPDWGHEMDVGRAGLRRVEGADSARATWAAGQEHVRADGRQQCTDSGVAHVFFVSWDGDRSTDDSRLQYTLSL